ncbi:hypothetical protein AAJP47_03560 [Psychrobacter sp. B38]|uniref:hypothetical protein n=1 Tax=Psychrobacter sp. B38 TaxID=3143538 RepID=UPI00320CDA13
MMLTDGDFNVGISNIDDMLDLFKVNILMIGDILMVQNWRVVYGPVSQTGIKRVRDATL